MMRYYCDIRLFDELEISLGFLWSKLYTQIHLSLVEIKDEHDRVDVGVSFPKYGDKRFPLGDTLRLFAPNKDRLEALRLEHYLQRLSDYIVLSEIKEVPDVIEGYALFKRVRFKSHTQIRRLAKRRAERDGIAYELLLDEYTQTAKRYEKLKCENKLPFVNLQSLSNANPMKLFIEKTSLNEAQQGDFSTYGLSDVATVPIF